MPLWRMLIDDCVWHRTQGIDYVGLFMSVLTVNCHIMAYQYHVMPFCLLSILIQGARCQTLSFAKTHPRFHGCFLDATVCDMCDIWIHLRAHLDAAAACMLTNRMSTESGTSIAIFLVVKLDAIFCAFIRLSSLERLFINGSWHIFKISADVEVWI